MDPQRGFANTFESRAFNGIQIEVQVIRSVHVVATGVPWIEIDAAEIDDPKQRRKIAHDWKINDAGGGMFYRTNFNPIWPGNRRALLKKEIAGGAVRISL